MSATIHACAGPVGITALPEGWTSESACAAGTVKAAVSRTAADARALRSDERLREEQKASDERLREEQKASDERLREEQKASDERLREEQKASDERLMSGELMGGEPSGSRRSCSIEPR
jgi:hypothetical protein